MKEPKNINYCAVVTTIKKIIPLENCDNVVHANVCNCLTIVSKDSKEGDKVLFFPVETQLSEEFLRTNNLYSSPEMNSDYDEKTKKGTKGYFGKNGRVRCVKFRKNASNGYTASLESLKFTGFDINCLRS